MTWGVVIPVGPGEVEVERLADTLDSVSCYEPHVGAVLLVDDAPTERRPLTEAAGALASKTSIIKNPRPGNVQPWSDGLVIGVGAGLKWFHHLPAVEWVLKMDTDALVIAPFADRLSREFADDHGVGLIGATDQHIDGTRRVNNWRRTIEKRERMIQLWRRPQPVIQTSLMGIGRARSAMLREARENGYQSGDHCQGGAYAISARAVTAVNSRGWLDGRLWLGTQTAEDVALAAEVCATGFTLKGLVGPGDPFAIAHVGLEAEPPWLRNHRYSIIHSVKGQGTWSEEEIRELFRSYRSSEDEDEGFDIGPGPAG